MSRRDSWPPASCGAKGSVAVAGGGVSTGDTREACFVGEPTQHMM